MLITFDDISAGFDGNDFLMHEILRSLPRKVLEDAKVRQLDVKLLINGVECEPKLLNEWFGGIEKKIELEGELLVKKKLEDLESDMRFISNDFDDLLKEVRNKVKNTMREKYNIILDEDEE